MLEGEELIKYMRAKIIFSFAKILTRLKKHT